MSGGGGSAGPVSSGSSSGTMNDPAAEAASTRLRNLAASGASIAVDNNVPCRRYFRSGLEMVRMANVYLDENNFENAYVLYIKYMTLFIEKIRKHPEYASVPAEMKAVNQTNLKEVMPKAEKLKVQLLDQYVKEYKKSIEEHKIKLKEAEERAKKQRKQQEQDERLAESLQADELRKFNNRDPGNSAMFLPSAPENPLWTNVSSSNMQDVLYPDDFATEPNRAPPGQFDPTPPIISRQSKPKLPSSADSVPPTTSHSGSLLSGGSALRTIIVPSTLMERFLKLSASNTKSNIETCGILAGKLERDRLLLTHMILPKQSGTADSCTTKNEEEIFYYQDQHNLITLGWIHTHPTQTAFLSSVDLHTQCSYQLMMPEAIAIVCAPKYNETGFFGLTPHYGMSFIANCRLSGFHPHPNDPPLFKDVNHIKLDDFASLEVIDLRR